MTTVLVAFGILMVKGEDGALKMEVVAAKCRYEAAKLSYETSPADSQKAFVEASVDYGTTMMMSPVMDRTVKYKEALKLYRSALKLDPGNKEAADNADMIVSIYQQMGRQVPE